MRLPIACLSTAICALGCPKTEHSPAQTDVRFLTPEPDRRSLNAALLERDLPLFWVEDLDHDGLADARELTAVWSMAADGAPDVSTGAIPSSVIGALAAPVAPEASDAQERARRAAVAKELAQGAPTLVFTDLSREPPTTRALAEAVSDVARSLEALYREQLGTHTFSPAEDHPPSRLLFTRNQGPWCKAPDTERDPDCTATPGAVVRSGLYPASLQGEGFCARMAEQPRADELLAPFVAVREEGGALKPMPYSRAFPDATREVAAKIRTLATRFVEDEEMQRYLEAAATAFETDDWATADAVWTRMKKSPWYLRIAPDEVFFSPCGRKAMFQLSFGRMSPDARSWQRKIGLFKQRMEDEVARLAGSAYGAREADFRLPDFVEIILNAGDTRRPLGAFIGQSLPNFGPLAEGGRRTVAYTNLYGDPDSHAQLVEQAASAFCPDTFQGFTPDDESRIINTAFHDVARNLGPGAGHRVRGKTPPEIFGGALAATLEELQAQAVSQHLAQWLGSKELLEQDTVRGMFTFGVIWALSHFSREMTTASGGPRPISQLAAIELGILEREGALTWTNRTAQNGTDEGCFSIDWPKVPRALETLARDVLRIKAAGRREAAQQLIEAYVDGMNTQAHDAVSERWRRFPRASFIYGIRTGGAQDGADT